MSTARVILILVGLALLAPAVEIDGFSSSVVAQSVDDFYLAAPRAPKGDVKVVENKKLTGKHGEAIKVVSATVDGNISTAEGFQAAYQKLKINGNGVRAVACEQGLGWVATASETYNATSKNQNLVRLSQRAAAVRADMKARRLMARTLNGLTFDSSRYLLDQMQAIDGETASVANTNVKQGEQVTTMIRGTLRGLATWHFSDHPETQTVQVSVVTTPLMISRLQARSFREVGSKTLEEGLEHVFAKIRKQIIPVVGSNFVMSEDGRGAWVGYGCTLKRKNRNKRIEQRLADAARESSARRALAALGAAIKGESLTANEAENQAFKESMEQIDQVLGDDGKTKTTHLAEDRYRTEASADCEMAIKTLSAGRLPPGTSQSQYEDSNWVWSVVVYSPQATSEAKALGALMAKGGIPMDVEARSKSYLVEPDGSLKRDEDGNLIVQSLGDGPVADPSDLGVIEKK